MKPLNKRYNSANKPNARILRNQPTEAEKKLWQNLKSKQLGVQFYRQKIIGSYIADFYSHEARMVIEADGGQHFETEKAIVRDKVRDDYLKSRGLRVLRFSNIEVLQNTEGVLHKIAGVLKA